MKFEVEVKFQVDDLQTVAEKLRALGASPVAERLQTDFYLNHPSRDFAVTDEALRIRSDEKGNRITYKGPKIDSRTKTRREIELSLAEGEAENRSWRELLTALGFRPVAEVVKRRQYWELSTEGADMEVVLDNVEGVGTYVELELSAEQDQLDAARERVEALSQTLGLTTSERRSYLELLLESRK